MEVNITIDKTDLPEPYFVRQTIEEHRRWRDIRHEKGLPTGALDNALRILQQTLNLVDRVYLKELRAEPEPLEYCRHTTDWDMQR